MNGNIIGWYGEEERDCCVDCIDCVKSKSVSRRRRQEKKDFLGVVSSKIFDSKISYHLNIEICIICVCNCGVEVL